jgi:superfamily I DNA/RNA helicase
MPIFEAIIVDEGQDFRPEWYEFLQTLLVSGEGAHFTVFLDEHQDIFHHWGHFPGSPPPAKKILTKNCRNTRAIVDYLNGVFPTDMRCYGASPAGTPVIERVTKNDVDEQTQVVRDVKELVKTNKVFPGSIVILLDSDKAESSLRETKSIDGIPLRSTYDRYDSSAPVIYYSQISIFKGLEADVALVVVTKHIDSKEIARNLYIQGSRARHVLYVYRRNHSNGSEREVA